MWYCVLSRFLFTSTSVPVISMPTRVTCRVSRVLFSTIGISCEGNTGQFRICNGEVLFARIAVPSCRWSHICWFTVEYNVCFSTWLRSWVIGRFPASSTIIFVTSSTGWCNSASTFKAYCSTTISYTRTINWRVFYTASRISSIYPV